MGEPPSEPTVADLDCEGSWACNNKSCVLTFTRTQAQSGNGADCPEEPSCLCTDEDDEPSSNGSDGFSVALIFAVVALSAVGLGIAYYWYSRRSTSATGGKSPAHSPPIVKGVWQHAADSTTQPQVGPGSVVQVWSKSSQSWCHGRVVKVLMDGHTPTVDVAYTVGGRDAKERRKRLPTNSGGLRFNPQQQQRQYHRRGGGLP